MATIPITVKIVGLDKIEKKLDYKTLMEPKVLRARDTITDRVMTPRNAKGSSKRAKAAGGKARGSRGSGVENNTLSAQLTPMGATITSTLNWPRTTGVSWQSTNVGIAKSIWPRAIKKAISEIEADWAS